MKNYLVELIGTFFFVLVIGLTVMNPGVGALAPLAIGLVLMVMVYAGGHISGAHYNPAVTLAVWLRKKIDTKEVPFYIIAQCVGAVLAAFTVGFLRSSSMPVCMVINAPRAFIAEILFTFALIYVILNVAVSSKTKGNQYFGLAIGLTVAVGVFAVGNISGGVFNPAIAIGITVMGLSCASKIWIYFLAQIFAATLAVGAFNLLNPDE